MQGAASTALVGAIGLFAIQPASAIEEANRPDLGLDAVEISSLEDEGVARTVDEWMAQISQAAVVQITGVRLNETPEGIELVLETSGELEVPEPSVVGSAAIADIPNAVLALPDGGDFLATAPAEGIALVNVINLPGDRVRVAITGADAPPIVEIGVGDAGLTLSAMPGTEPAEDLGDEAIRVVVTGEGEDDYFVPNATTATRTDTPLRDIPQSIQVVPREVFEDQQITRLEEALANVSSVVPSSGVIAGGDAQFNIRGFEAPILRDGFRRFSGFEDFPETVHLERVEVLKGPASILYGEIQPGGIINLVSKQPLSESYYESRLQIGDRARFRPQFDITGPLTSDERLLYRLNALFSTDNGFRGYTQDDERGFLAPVLSWQAGDRTNLTFQAEYSNRQAPADVGLPALGNSVISVPNDRVVGEPSDFVDSVLINAGYNLEHKFSDSWQLRNAFRFLGRDLLDVVAVPVGGFDESTGILTRFASQQELDTREYALQTNVVGDFATGPIEHTLLVGVDISRFDEDELTRFDFFNPNPLDVFDPVFGTLDGIDPDSLPTFIDNSVQSDRLGVYIQDQIDLLDNLILVAGVRYDLVGRRTTARATDGNPVASETTQEDDAFSPRFGIVYQPIPEISLYGSYSRSFTPSFDVDSDGNPLEVERGEGFEVGVRAEMLDGNLSATLAYFDITRENVATPDPDDIFSSVATGEQKSRGIELDVIGEILPGWNIIASYAYIDAEVTEDNAIPEGNRLFNTPEHSASLWTTYRIQRGDLEGLGFGVGFNFVGEREGDLENSFQLGTYFLTNAAVFYRRENWSLALNFNNIFDVDFIASSNNSRSFQNLPGEPFSVLGSISVEF